MYTHTQCPMCDAIGVKDDHAIQVVEIEDLYEEPFLNGLGLYDHIKRRYAHLERAYCGYHHDFVSDWHPRSSNLYDHLYKDAPDARYNSGLALAFISSRLNLSNVRFQVQTDFGFTLEGILFIKATFLVRGGTVQQYGYYIMGFSKSGNEILFTDCQEINTGQVRTFSLPIPDRYESGIIRKIAADLAQWQILEGQ
ncbi:MAG TPA: hypothetical protein PLB32_00880 [Acidobacteriota bacterium]|nr:hypothetical protein [Acidobacteriota bacterium]